ncbi:MAG: SDR family oxidoreductase [Parvularculaceae bacterium]|nr:SDR family oxidoreductase [Parvularculaceae bacterium]
MSDPLDFAGKTVIVTGAAGGIGRACAEAFAKAGAAVALADIDSARVEAAASEIAAATGSTAIALAADVADDAACERLVEETMKRLGRIDVLVNNAAILAKGTALDLSPDDFDRVLRVNLRAPFVLTQLVARKMVEKRIKGAIVNMSSVQALLAIPHQLAYVTSKGGLAQLTRVTALALAEHGVRVNAIGPGSIMTDLLKQVMTDDAARRMILSRTPMGRVGEPEEIAAIALFLASPLASYVTGQTIYADGGRLPLNYVAPVTA